MGNTSGDDFDSVLPPGVLREDCLGLKIFMNPEDAADIIAGGPNRERFIEVVIEGLKVALSRAAN